MPLLGSLQNVSASSLAEVRVCLKLQAPVDHKLNCGEELLRGLFAKWLDGLKQLQAAEQQPANGQPGHQLPASQPDG